MYKYLLLSATLFLFSSKAISNEQSSCPNKYFQGNVKDLVDIEIREPYSVESGDYNYDVRFDVYPIENYLGLELYGGAIQHGFPKGSLSFMDLSEKKNGRTLTSIFSTIEAVKSLKMRLWFSNENCHMTAAFMLTGIESISEAINASDN